MITINKGLNLPIDGAPRQQVYSGPTLERVALIGDDYVGMKPLMMVGVGDSVRLGDVLFADKKDQERNVVIEKSSVTPTKKIHFLNMHPDNDPEKSLTEVRNLIP